jgi:hypothetical protein
VNQLVVIDRKHVMAIVALRADLLPPEDSHRVGPNDWTTRHAGKVLASPGASRHPEVMNQPAEGTPREHVVPRARIGLDPRPRGGMPATEGEPFDTDEMFSNRNPWRQGFD